MITWTLQIVGRGTNSLAGWKATSVVLRRVNLSPDVLSFSIPKKDPFDDPICNFGETAKLIRTDDKTGVAISWFEGRRILVPFDSSASSEAQIYTFANAWHWLATNIFQQPWYGGVYTSHLILIGFIGGLIKKILDYAIANGAPLQYVASDLTALAVTPPSNEITGQSCASVILNLLQFAPDTVSWFDYSTTPSTLRFGQRPALPAANLAAPDEEHFKSRVSASRIIAREDLQVPAVKICFETIDTIDGKPRLLPGVDIWPPGATGREDRALSDTVVLQGRNIATVQATLVCETIDVDSLSWWSKAVPALSDPRVVPGSLSFTATPRTRIGRDGAPSLNLPRMLVEGQTETWQINPDQTAVVWQEEEITGEFAYEIWETPGDSSTKIKVKAAQKHSFHLTSTNAPAGTTYYSSVASVEQGDPVIIGLAKYLFDSLNPLQWEAAISLLEQDCSGLASIGQVLNLSGLRDEFATMRALIQEVAFVIDSGETQITCGPARHLSISEILAILRANRFRRRWTNPNVQTDGDVSNQGNVQLGRGMPNTNTIPGNEVPSYSAVKQADQKIVLNAQNMILDMTKKNDDRRILMDFADATWLAATKRAFGPRVITVCELINGVDTQRKMLVIGTETWPAT